MSTSLGKSGRSGRGKATPAARKRAAGTATAARRPTSEEADANLLPALRDRIIKELDDGGVASRDRVQYLMKITGRSKTACRRWVHETSPGLPDLESFYKLAIRFQSDVNYLLGLSKRRLPLPSSSQPANPTSSWQPFVLAAVGKHAEGATLHVQRGDEMSPQVCDGDLVFVDHSVHSVGGNGTYLIEYSGKTLLRIVEDRLAAGYALRCENPRYQETLVPRDALESAKPQYRVLGKALRTMKLVAVP